MSDGKFHAATGLIAGALAGYLLRAGAAQDAGYAFLCAGAALLPDADHETATISKSAGPVTRLATTVIAAVTGEHRGGMHSIPGVAAIGVLLWAASLGTRHSRLSLGIVIGVFTILLASALTALRVVKRRHHLYALVLGAAGAVLSALYLASALWWLTVLGMAIHIGEDLLTGWGCRLLWPFTGYRFGHRQPVRGSRPAPRRR